MIKKVFPVGSKQFTFLKNVFSKFDRISIDNLEILFPFWCMLAFQHHLVKSYDISTFRFMDIDLDNGYIFSLVFEDWIGVISIILHSILLLWLMKKFDFFGPFRTVKIDFQTNFLLFTALYALLDIIIFGKMMFGFFLILLSLYILYRSQSFFSQLICLLLTIITLVFSLAINEPILSTSAAIFIPILLISMISKSQKLVFYSQKNLPLIIFIFVSTKELWFGFIGLFYFLLFNMYYYFVHESNYNWLKFDLR